MMSVILFLFAALLQNAPAPSNRAARPPQASYEISGIVADASSGTPLARAEVSIAREQEQTVLQTIVTATDGRFVFTNLPPGKYSLHAKRRGYVSQAYQQHEVYWTAIAVGPGLDSANLRFTLMPNASISGTVTDETGEPIRGARVMLHSETLASGKRTTVLSNGIETDDEGRYYFGHLMPGTYFVGTWTQPWYAQPQIPEGVEQPGMLADGTPVRVHGVNRAPRIITRGQNLDVVYRPTFFADANQLSNASPLALRAGDSARADISLQATPAFHVIVHVPENGEPGNINVLLTQSSDVDRQASSPFPSVRIAPGTYEFVDVAPGEAEIITSSNNGGEEGTKRKVVQINGPTEIDASDAPSAPVLSGVIKSDTGERFSGPIALMFHNTENDQTWMVATDGSRNSELKDQQAPGAGKYAVSVGQPGGYAVRSIHAEDAKTTGAEIELTSGRPVRVTIVIARADGTITGTVLREGKPVAGAMVVLVPADADLNETLVRRDQSDSDGTFTLRQVVTGKYVVVAIQNGWDLEWAKPEVLKKYLSGGTPVSLNPGGSIDVKVNVQ